MIMRYEIPIWEKSNLTPDEAAAYSGIGVNKLRRIYENARRAEKIQKENVRKLNYFNSQ